MLLVVMTGPARIVPRSNPSSSVGEKRIYNAIYPAARPPCKMSDPGFKRGPAIATPQRDCKPKHSAVGNYEALTALRVILVLVNVLAF